MLSCYDTSQFMIQVSFLQFTLGSVCNDYNEYSTVTKLVLALDICTFTTSMEIKCRLMSVIYCGSATAKINCHSYRIPQAEQEAAEKN